MEFGFNLFQMLVFAIKKEFLRSKRTELIKKEEENL